MVAAARDPDGANLDRVQVIKGWLDATGQLREKVYDVSLSGDRNPTGDTKPSAVGSTVDLDKPSYSNTIGAAELRALWRDPDFDPGERAFYYVRVLEIPKPSWQSYDIARFGDSFPEEVTRVVQDRAYTSPIWYDP